MKWPRMSVTCCAMFSPRTADCIPQNTNINRQIGQQQQEGYNVSGSTGRQITLK